MSDGAAPTATSNLKLGLSWAPYLACSWTWCIGMFLPILFLRDFGWLGFVMFAVPNVLGAAAVGWVIRSPAASRRWIRAHGPVMRLFGWVTIAFHAYWLGFLTRWLPFENAETIIVWNAIAMGLVSLLAVKVSGRQLAWALWPFSCVVFLTLTLMGNVQPTPAAPLFGPSDSDAILWLTPVVAFGFLFCPLLDLTLHKARRATPGAAGPIAFGVGYGVCFLTMILLTSAYAGRLLSGDAAAGISEFALVAHLVAQLCFTVGEHTRTLADDTPTHDGPKRSTTGGAITLVFAAMIGAGMIVGGWPQPEAGLAPGEIGYRVILSAYGLLFPSYVWICVIPRGGGRVAKPSHRALAVWLIACAIAAPLFTQGFIRLDHIWLAPGLGVLLLARLFVPRASAGVQSA